MIDPIALRARVRAIWPLVVAAAHAHQVGPELLAAVVDRESLCGTSKQLVDLTGDFTPRPLSKRYQPGALYKPATLAVHLPDKTVEYHPAVMPKDGLGWGRGLGQIDLASHADWLATHDWRDPAVNLDAAAGILRASIIYCGDEAAGVAGYNAGAGRAREVLAKLEAMPGGATDREKLKALDAITAGGNYASDVYARRACLLVAG